jgi:antitoxin component YwqK of YwqJK toxin-antitoxin module
MTRRIFIRFFFIFLFCGLLGDAKGRDTIYRYLNTQLAITRNEREAAYFAKMVKRDRLWKVWIYDAVSQTLALEGHFKNNDLTMRHGWFRLYHPNATQLMNEGAYEWNVMQGDWQSWHVNGQKRDSGRMSHGKAVGLWKHWHDNGQLKTRGAYIAEYYTKKIDVGAFNRADQAFIIFQHLQRKPEMKAGLWQQWHANGQLQDSVFYEQGKRSGIFKSWYANGQLDGAGVYRDGMEESTWQWFRSSGKPSSEELYVNGRLSGMKCFDSSGRYTGDFCSLNKPALFGAGASSFEDYIQKNFRYSPEAKAKNARGGVLLRFTVNEKGRPENLVFDYAAANYFKTELKRLIDAMPDWEPAVSHNRIARFEVTLMIPYIYFNRAANKVIFDSRGARME